MLWPRDAQGHDAGDGVRSGREDRALDWTIVRAAVLKGDPSTGSYTATNSGPITKIDRADVALALVDQLTDFTHRGAAISVTA